MSWGEQFAARRTVQARYKTVWRVPIVRKLAQVIDEHVAQDARVLDVGAGERNGRALVPGRAYESLDPDPHTEHDHRDLAQVEGRYGGILFLEVIEHLGPEEALDTLKRLRELLDPGGVLIVSTPNTFHPPAYLRDATHRTPFCYDELGGVLAVAGFEVTALVRVYNDAIWRKLLRRYAFGWLFRLLSLDFAPQIAAVARPREVAGGRSFGTTC
jgi:hypothetical protein